MLESSDNRNFSIPPKLKAIYEDFKPIVETASYRLFEAQTRNSHEKHSIRVLDPTKDLVANNFDSAATLFIQELFHLHTRCPGSVLINTLEINEDRKQIGCAIRQYSLVTPQIQEIQGSMDLKNPKVIEKLLNDVISDVEFLWGDLKMKNIASIMEPGKIYYLKGKGTFFLGNWDEMAEENTGRSQDLTSTIIDSLTSELRSQNIAAEIKALAFTLLKMKKVDVDELEFLSSSKRVKIPTYDAAVKSAVEEGFSDSQKLQNLMTRMLSLDPKNLPNLEEFKIKEDKIPMTIENVNNEANRVTKEVGIQVELEESKINPSSNSVIINPSSNSVIIDSPLTSTPPTLLAWCSQENNKISIIDLETKQNYVTFDGVRISDPKNSRTHLKEIPNTKLLVSLHHNYEKSANIEIFDISKKGEANKIYSLGEITGLVSEGDVTYNSRRSILGAIPVAGKIAYHLFNVDANVSNADNIVMLSRKSKWHWQYTNEKDNLISGFDFNSAGDSIATIDKYGMCLISDVNTDNYGFHLQVGSKADKFGRCRWSTNTGEPLLFVKYNEKILNILDVENKVLISKNPAVLHMFGFTDWIDVCPSNGNLVALSDSSERIIKIYDKRELKIVKAFEGVQSSYIYCGRWSPSGDMIVNASHDRTAKLMDFKTGKLIYTCKNSDGRAAMSACFI